MCTSPNVMFDGVKCRGHYTGLPLEGRGTRTSIAVGLRRYKGRITGVRLYLAYLIFLWIGMHHRWAVPAGTPDYKKLDNPEKGPVGPFTAAEGRC
ncbi:unnamed protein product, partial [Dicrocoelium dendriticum]